MAPPERCLLCGGADFEKVHAGVRDYEHGLPQETDFSRCTACGLMSQAPQPSLEALLAAYPQDYRPHVAGSSSGGLLGFLKGIQSRQLVGRYARWLPKDKSARILDLGCGGGQFLKALHGAGYTNLTGVDRNAALAAHFEGTPITFRAAELEPDFDLDGRYNTIVLNYVLEHFLNPLRILEKCRGLLEDGGQVLVLTPNTDSISHQLFGRYWSGLHAPRHTHVFTPKTLERAAQGLGFKAVEAHAVLDPASWAFSFQNFLRARDRSAVPKGTAWYSLAGLPLWLPFAAAEQLMNRSASTIASLK